ncbi:MAG: hypothetical protein V4501_11205 [Pseudomonadota bacterium]
MTEEAEELLGTGDLPPQTVEPVEDSNHESAIRKPNFAVAKQKAKLQGRKEMADELAGFQEQLLAAMESRLDAKLANLAGVNQATNPAMPLDEETILQRVEQRIYQRNFDAAVTSARSEYESLLAKAVASNPDIKDGLDIVEWSSMDLVAANIVKSGIDNPEDVIAALIDDPASIDTLMASMAANHKRGVAALKKYSKDLSKANTTTSRARSSNIPAPSGHVRSNPGGAHQDDDSWDDLANDPTLR